MTPKAEKTAPQLVIHEDDVGMCHGANTAFLDLAGRGICTSGSVMVPCPWFPEIAAAASENPSLDLGVHFTLTSEKRFYRWSPLTRAPQSAGLTDKDGYFWNNVGDLRRRAHPEAIEAEMRAQVDRALGMGIDVTHFDAHQFAAMAPEFVDIYLRLGQDYRVPVMFPRQFGSFDYAPNLGEVDLGRYEKPAASLAERGNPLFDRILETPWGHKGDARQAYETMLGDIADGRTFLALHFNAPGEIEVIEPESARTRIDEYGVFGQAGFGGWLRDRGFALIGFRDFRDEMRRAAA
ncbi:MAG: polysaccharide deacetylase family protein [Dongiaceae bacterium]